jgi:hypothetical protein
MVRAKIYSEADKKIRAWDSRFTVAPCYGMVSASKLCEWYLAGMSGKERSSLVVEAVTVFFSKYPRV